MATYKFIGTITVPNCRSRAEAINELQVMLNDYEDNNSESCKDITIHWDKVERETNA